MLLNLSVRMSQSEVQSTVLCCEWKWTAVATGHFCGVLFFLLNGGWWGLICKNATGFHVWLMRLFVVRSLWKALQLVLNSPDHHPPHPDQWVINIPPTITRSVSLCRRRVSFGYWLTGGLLVNPSNRRLENFPTFCSEFFSFYSSFLFFYLCLCPLLMPVSPL